jgi:hypothetical protein
MSHITWPSSLQPSTCGVEFHESLEFVSSLALTFGYSFNRSLEDVTLPSCLKIWIFGYEFTQSGLEACMACQVQSELGFRFAALRPADDDRRLWVEPEPEGDA